MDHPQAALLRWVALATLEKTLQRIERTRAADADQTAYAQLSQLVSASCFALAEVADPASTESIRKLLEQETDARLGLELMRLPGNGLRSSTFYQSIGLCGVGLTPETIREHQQREAASFQKQKQELLRWLKAHSAQP